MSSVAERCSGGRISDRLAGEDPPRRRCDNVAKKNSSRQTLGKTDRIRRADPMQALIRARMLLDKRPAQPQHFAHSKRDDRLESSNRDRASSEIAHRLRVVLQSSIVSTPNGSPNHSPGMSPRMNGSTAERMRVHDAGSRRSARVGWAWVGRDASTPYRGGGSATAGCRLNSTADFPISFSVRPHVFTCGSFFLLRQGKFVMRRCHALLPRETGCLVDSIVPAALSDFPLTITRDVIS